MGITVLSLCDGMSCGHIALDKLDIKVDKYFASEVKPIAIKVTQYNYPDTIQIGDVNKVTYNDGWLCTEKGNYKVGSIDLVMFGSPCQTLSCAMRNQWRNGLNDKNKSGLFYECYRVLKEVNPKWFLMENVGSMREADKDTITKIMGVKPVRINSADFGPALRDRLYWTNIPITMHKIRNININDILDDGFVPTKKARALLVSGSRPLSTPCKMVYRDLYKSIWTLVYKSKEHYNECVAECVKLSNKKGSKLKASDLDNYTGHVFDGVRYLNQRELEICQTIPIGYTECLTRNEAADVLGDGWTVDVIAHIFSFIPKEDYKD